MKAYTEDARDPGYTYPDLKQQPPPPDQGEHDYFPGEADRNLFEEIPEHHEEGAMKSTPTPWTLQTLEHNHNGYTWPTFAVRSPENYCLAIVGDVERAAADQNEANARFIVTAVNSHDALVTALKNLCAVAHAFEGHPNPSDPVHAMLPLAIKLAWDVIALAAAEATP
jgi:hypothetical protein